MGAGAAAEAAGAHVSAARLSPQDRLALPAVRHGGPRARSCPAKRDWKVLIEGNRARSRPRSSRRTAGSSCEEVLAQHGRFEDVMSTDPAFFKRLESPLSRARLRHPEGRPARARHLVDQVRPRRGADDRPDQPLQHDVRSVLHGRQPGRLRPRARVGRGQEDPRRRGLDQAAPPAVRAVLRRRADALAPLPAGDPLRAQDRLLLRAVRDQRDSLRPGRRVRAGRPRRRACASPTCSSTASATSTTRTARSATCSTSSCARSRTSHRPASTSRSWSPIVNAVNDDQVGDIITFAIENIDKITRSRSSPSRSPAATRTSTTRRASEAALHAVAPRPRREAAGGHRRADARLVPAVGVRARSPT